MQQAYQQVLDIVRGAVDAGRCPGAAAAVGCRSGVLAEGCFGTAAALDEPFCPVTPDTVYDMASLSKILAATTLCLQDFESGTLSPQQTVGGFYPDALADKRGLTLCQLMTHTAGLKPWIMLKKLAASPEDADAVILRTPLEAEPGMQVHYSDLGFILLGHILERIHGQPLTKLARTRVFAPLGMRDTGYFPDAVRCAPTERDPSNGRWLRGEVHDENARFLHGNSGNAGVFSTLRDMECYAAMLANGGRAENGVFLSESILRQAVCNYTPSLSENRGIGFKLQGGVNDFIGPEFGAAAFGHTGFTGTSLAVDPVTGLYVVLLSNRVHPIREPNLFIGLREEVHGAAMPAWRQQEGEQHDKR